MSQPIVSYAYMPTRCDERLRRELLLDAIEKLVDHVGEERFVVKRAGPFRFAGEGLDTHKVDTSDADNDRFYEVSVLG